MQLDYLYASPLDLASLDVRAEIDALAAIPGVKLTVPGGKATGGHGGFLRKSWGWWVKGLILLVGLFSESESVTRRMTFEG